MKTAFKKNAFAGKSETQIKKIITKRGFRPFRITNSPGYTYEAHEHSTIKLLVFLSGSMEIDLGGQVIVCQKNDQLSIEPNTIHSAIVGKKGCEFFWAEKEV